MIRYARWLFGVTIPLLVHYGICLEAHGQNILVRLHLDTGAIAGFAVRDLGGIRIHMPTLHKNGYDLKTALPGSSIITDDLHEVWSKAHHTLIQNHMNQFIRGLRLQREGGWAIAREELKSVLQADKDENARRLDEFLFAEKVPFKCFIRMQMAGVYRNVSFSLITIHCDKILWELSTDMLNFYQPSTYIKICRTYFYVEWLR